MISGISPKNDRIRRRDALRLAGQAGLAAAGSMLLGRCKGSTTPDPEPPPVAVDVLVKFYNHTQGYLGEKVYSGQSGSPLVIKVADCPDINTVDPNRLAVRETANGGWLGKYVEYSKTGQLTAAKFPKKVAIYDAFMMNITNGADYDLIDYHPSGYGGRTFHSPNATWLRDDDEGCEGPDDIPREAMRQIGEALIFPWARYMAFTEVTTPPDFFTGYLCPPNPPANTYRGYAHSFAGWVNPAVCKDQGHPLLRVFLEQIFKHLTGCLFAHEVAPVGMLTYQYMTDESSINAVGKDLLAYVPAKDVRNA
jgi:hypothetical protein